MVNEVGLLILFIVIIIFNIKDEIDRDKIEKHVKLSKNEINELPLIKYEGNIKILSSKDNIQKAINDLKNYDLIGFDTETRPTFVKGH